MLPIPQNDNVRLAIHAVCLLTIVVGVVVLVVLALFGYELDGSHDHDRKTAGG